MTKLIWKPGTMIYPLPAVMVSCGASREEYNIITVSWTGTICTDPAMCYVSIRPDRYSHEIIKKNREFVINITTKELAFATDWCGVKSGRDHDKFKEMKLTPEQGSVVSAPLIKEAPINIECQVMEIKELGSHDMFLAEVVSVNVDDQYLDKETNAFELYKAEPLIYSHGKYFAPGEFLGKFGWSVKKDN